MMKGFKNSTKAVSGHHFPGSAMHHMASGGIVAPLGSAGPRMSGGASRPILPRPRVMPQMKMQSIHKAKLARGGSYGQSDGAGGPYNPPEGNTLSMANRPYSKDEQDYPRMNVRPGYARGGKKPFGGVKKGALHKDMGIPQGKKIPVSKIRSKLSRDKASGNTKGVKRDVFAINAKTKFADGGSVGCNEGAVQGIAQAAVNRHVATKPPQGHGVRPKGNLAFMSKPLYGKDS